MEIWQIWVIVGVILFIAEILTAGFFLACFGVGCLGAGLVAFLGLGVGSQIMAFAVITIVVFFTLRPFFVRLHSPTVQIKTNVDALVGKTGRVSETIDPITNTGRIIVGGEDWRAVSTDGTAIERGKRVVVLKVEGAKLLVKEQPMEKEE